jgi:hypothetical protein
MLCQHRMPARVYEPGHDMAVWKSSQVVYETSAEIMCLRFIPSAESKHVGRKKQHQHNEKLTATLEYDINKVYTLKGTALSSRCERVNLRVYALDHHLVVWNIASGWRDWL